MNAPSVSGQDAASKIDEGLRQHGAEIHYERVAITLDQVHDLDLVTHSVNWNDPRAKSWPYDFSCELDALPTPILRLMVADCIEQHIDQDVLHHEMVIEKEEKKTLEAVLEGFVQEQES